jgi:hypothetical protein
VSMGSSDGTPERLYLLGATFVEGRGLERQTITSSAPFVARYELGRWWAEPFPSRLSEQG